MDFCMKIMKHLMLAEIEDTNPANVVLSPLSLNVILNMIVAGTRGATLELVLGLLGAESVEEINKKSCEIMALANFSDKDGPIVTSINAVWVDKSYPVKASYAELLKRVYDCEARTSCDFANKADDILNEINSWAEAASRGLIKNVIGHVSPLTTYVRANAIYFKGSWVYPFDPEYAHDQEFFLLDGTTIQVPFLRTWQNYPYGSFDGYKVLRMPYESGSSKTSFSMYFFLPDERSGLPKLVKTFNSCSKNLFLNLDLEYTDLEVVQIPKFKISYKAEDMHDTMVKMGLMIPYKGNQHDYGEMIEAPEELPPSRSKIIQKAFIEIDEYGTEASAVTIEEDVGFCYFPQEPPPPRPKFVADHPFMFIIKEDESGLVFFTGLVLDPRESDD